MELFIIAALVGGLFYFSKQKKGEPIGEGGIPPKWLQEGKECPYGGDKPIEDLPEEIRNAITAAIVMESDPKELRNFADQLDKLCQPTAATALRRKADELEKIGVPAGFDPNVVSIPIPGLDSSPEPSGTVPNAPAPGLINVTQETSAGPMPGKPGVASSPITQWWTGPLIEGDSPWLLAKKVTGDGRRYVELMIANPEKPTVGEPTRPFATGYSFVSFKIGERIRVPRSWNIYIDQTGKTKGDGVPLPVSI